MRTVRAWATATMAQMSTTSHVQVFARVSGVLYLLIIAAGLFAQVVRDRFVVAGNAAATASNITADAFLYRLSIVADLSTFVCCWRSRRSA